MNFYYITGIIMIAVAIVINYSINRRRFYRRGPGGLQHFNRYSESVIVTVAERLGKFIALVLFLLGIGALMAGRHQQNLQKKIGPTSEHLQRNSNRQ
ncbi:molybdenum ABC transporter permease [Pedobacter sp. BS3]|uniref:molybdenum ABC transporter permease n=1 Tax=Pedobacter sp. BS3 TaxID=2567937 RepID=UPI0011EC5A5D|nr:molybdenum ABC transporter permease [Pedobacter sp. BS3]TZF83599.1 molybdenum ABC transporter permease [Pedobacter sp. BS3]